MQARQHSRLRVHCMPQMPAREANHSQHADPSCCLSLLSTAESVRSYGQVADLVKMDRLNRLNRVVNEVAEERAQRFAGRELEVLFPMFQTNYNNFKLTLFKAGCAGTPSRVWRALLPTAGNEHAGPSHSASTPVAVSPGCAIDC